VPPVAARADCLGEWDVQKMANVEELPPKPFSAANEWDLPNRNSKMKEGGSRAGILTPS